jgi:hypothetical protein
MKLMCNIYVYIYIYIFVLSYDIQSLRHEILVMNGFDPYKEDAEAGADILEALLLESETQFEHDRDTKIHANGRMSKYFYKKDHGVASSSGSTVTQKWTRQAAPSAKALKDFDASNKGEPLIKFENPDFVRLVGRVRVLRDGKKMLERKLNELKDKKAGVKDEARALKDQANTAAVRLEEFIDSVRSHMAQADTATMETEGDDIQKILDASDELIQKVALHSEAMKGLLARIKADK